VKGLTLNAIKAVEKMIDNKFDSIALNFLGIIPNQVKSKKITFTIKNDSLVSLFARSLGSVEPTKEENDLLKVILNIANGYIESLKERTKARIVNDVDAYIKDQKGKDISLKDIREIMSTEMGKAKNHFKMIANNESNKCINYGMAMRISKMAERSGQEDPTIFFRVTIDDVTGPEEFVLHLLPDKITPRVWKLSEVKNGYHKRGDPNPNYSGLHVNCRCKISYLAPDFGFDKNGKVTFKGIGYDEFESQRAEYGLPRDTKEK